MNNNIHWLVMAGITISVITGIMYYQFVYDPVSYQLMYDCDDPYFANNLECTNHKYVASAEISTHLKTGLKDYTINISDGIGSASP